MPRNLGESVVVITGASSGIGRATALRFARKGASVVLAARNAEALSDVLAECERLGAGALAVPTDVSDEAAVQALAQQALDTFGHIDVWVNNAAVTLFGRFEETPPEAWRRVIETNVFGYVHGARAALSLFREQGHGVLINVSSMNGRIGAPYASAYITSKFAIRGLGESLRQELLDEKDVHVVTVLPASTDTPIFQHGGNYSGRALQPLSPIYTAERVARAIVNAARWPRRELLIGSSSRTLVFLHKLMPGVTERLMARQVERDHFQDAPAAPSPGNLFAPQEPASISGGWRSPPTTRVGLGLLGGALLVPALLGGWRLWGNPPALRKLTRHWVKLGAGVLRTSPMARRLGAEVLRRPATRRMVLAAAGL
jgi:NAD(P)-dependent dehydrogenase (short-subunit alcohol dehydrogenase family)